MVNHEVKYVAGDITDRSVLDAAEVTRFKHVITLSYADKYGVQQADAVTLVTLLHLRAIEESQGDTFSVVSEMLDLRNQKLAEVTGTDDFIVSENLVSLLLAQLAENKALGAVFEDLFDADGAEIYLKDAGDYVAVGESVDFFTVVEAARRRGRSPSGTTSRDRRRRARRSSTRRRASACSADDRVVVLADS